MFRKLTLTTILVSLAVTPAFAQKQRFANVDANGNLDALIARHAAANNLPEDLVRRVIKRESGGNARAVSAGNYGLMQIKLADRPFHGLHRHRRRVARCRYQHDLCGEISCRRLSRRQRQFQPRGALLRRRLLLRGQEQGHGNAFQRPDVGRLVCVRCPGSSIKVASEQKLGRAYTQGKSVASSSSLYSGRLDYH